MSFFKKSFWLQHMACILVPRSGTEPPPSGNFHALIFNHIDLTVEVQGKCSYHKDVLFQELPIVLH